MPIETSILGCQNRGEQNRGDLGEADPGEPAHLGVNPHFVDQLPVAIEDPGVGGPMPRAHHGEVRDRRGRLVQKDPAEPEKEQRSRACEDDRRLGRPSHGWTSTPALGSSPNISGA